jgi:hypothetical protein
MLTADISMEPSESAQDLGWKQPEDKKKKRKSAFVKKATAASEQESAAERKQLTVVGLN